MLLFEIKQAQRFLFWIFTAFLFLSSSQCFGNSNQRIDPSSQITVAALSSAEVKWIGQRIYQNECASRPENLIHWNQGEEFPSLGIGHFIWYPANYSGPFQETFPKMFSYVDSFSVAPAWLKRIEPFKAPWQNRDQFQQKRVSNQTLALQKWLQETHEYQALFIVEQFRQRLIEHFELVPVKTSNARLIGLINRLLSFKEGRFALIDYTNFKGIGSATEQYQGEQWGLISVLIDVVERQPEFESLTNQVLLDEFIQSAKNRLKLRVKLAPKSRGEQRWLKGWFTRLGGYRN